MNAILVRIADVSGWPLWLRKAIVDFLSVFLVALAGLSVAVPAGANWRDWLIAFGLAVGNVALNALRRAVAGNLPDALQWLAVLFGTNGPAVGVASPRVTITSATGELLPPISTGTTANTPSGFKVSSTHPTGQKP